MPRILVPEPMTRFKCNERGCCCQEWRIDFQPEELIALQAALPASERKGLLRRARVWVGSDDETVEGIQLETVGPECRCRFLEDGGQCRLHVQHGPEILPHLCVRYPGFSFQRDDGELELHFDTVCPEVLARLAESDAPLELVSVEPPPDHHLSARAREPSDAPAVQIGNQTLTNLQFETCRDRILEALADESRDALDLLCAINHALARLGQGAPPEGFHVAASDPPEDFADFFEDCVGAHGERVFARYVLLYRRFVFDIPMDQGDPKTLAAALEYDPDWAEVVRPRDPAFQGLLRRYLAHRYFAAYGFYRTSHELAFNYGAATHTLAAAFRIARGVSRWLSRPVDRPLLLMSIGAAEYFSRATRVERSSMPWFGLPLDLPDDSDQGVLQSEP
ncbi:MAG: hypothetical protein R3F39_02010 [Myxococcota bacterium]